jgi:cell wall-associated NlpC family hydrolase
MKLITTLLLSVIALAGCNETTEKEKAPKVIAAATVNDADEAKRAEIVAYAKELLGTKYCYAGSTPNSGFDCSGFVNYVFTKNGIDVPRSSKLFANAGTDVNPEDIQVGDVLVFYGYRDSDSVGHVGIVTEADGMQSKFIHSSSGKEMAVMISDLGSDMYTDRFFKAVDVID